jgi:DNA mismatch repair protein MutS
MAGKSTVIRQVALISLMGQVGSFVPADSASLGIVDQIFSRVGASDNLSQGLSTFMVEMTETAHILKHATEKSLVILDEIGRGTSTFDGLAIAWSVAEHLSDEICARTMFATHYHELTDLARTREQVKNISVAVKEWNDEIVFLRKLVDGPSNRSYGIQVGRLAGIPKEVISRAKEILAELETMAFDSRRGQWVGDAEEEVELGFSQLDLFSKPGISPNELKALNAIKEIIPEELTPLDALNLIYTLKGELDRGS